MPDPFEILGVPRRFKLDRAQLEQRHRDLSRALHPDRHANATPAERRVSLERAVQVNDAFRALKSPLSRATALLATAGRVIPEQARAGQALLMEVMELRERLEEAKHSPVENREREVSVLRDEVARSIATEEDAIASAFDGEGDTTRTPDATALDRAHDALIKLRYYHRFLEEADAIFEET